MSNIQDLAAERARRAEDSSKKTGAVVRLIEIGSKRGSDLSLFHDAGGRAYAIRPLASGGTRALCLSSGAFRSWLAGEYYRRSGGKEAASAEAINAAIGVLTARALDEEECEAHIRVAEYDGNIYLDLADESGRVVEISATGWQITTRPPVRFRCERGMLPLLVPERGGSLEELRGLINAPGDVQWRLLVAWLIASLRPGRPFPVLVLQGEQGSAKSTTGRLLRGLIDPARPPDRARPRNDQDLAIAARNAWILSYDNISTLPDWLSDALCRIATGGGFATRKLYADDDEAIFDFSRPVMLNGIDDLLTRPDLADRALRVTLPTIADEHRRTTAAVLAEYEAARPRILGALCDAVSGALRGLPEAERRITSSPRMADFALWASAAEDALGWPQGAFLAAYAHNRGELVSESLEDDPVAAAIRDLLVDDASWTGMASELLKRLAEIAGIDNPPSRNWPSSPRQLSSRLRRLAPLLLRVDIEWEPPKPGASHSDRRHSLVRKQPPQQPKPPGQSPNHSDSRQNVADNTGARRLLMGGFGRSANGQQPAASLRYSSDAGGLGDSGDPLHTPIDDTPNSAAAGNGKVVDVREHETGAQAEPRWLPEAARRSADSYRAEEKRLRAKGDLEEATKYERWAVEEENKLAGATAAEGLVR